MSHGELRIRRADAEKDQDRILAVLRRNLPAAASAERHAWLYLSNPCGRSYVWLAEDAKTGEPVGTSAGHPKRVRVAGRIETTLNLSDFAIDPGYRSLGPALALLRATLEPMQSGEFAFSYEHPGERMLAIYKRMGARDVSRWERWTRPLELSPAFKRRWGHGFAVRVAGGVGDAALRAKDALQRRPRGVRVELLGGDCGVEFDHLDEALANDAPVRGARSSEHLRWRYLQNATGHHEILCARVSGVLLGYLVFRERGSVLAVVDLVTVRDDAIRAALVDELVAIGHARRKTALDASVLAGSPAASALAALGFVRRNDEPGVVVHGPRAAPEIIDALSKPTNWWTLEGDQDV